MIRSSLSPLLLVALVAALALPAGAEAQGKRAAKAEAKALFQDAQKHYTLGEFEPALEKFTAAYDKLPLAAFLFNIAQCHKEMKNYERAVFFFEGYLRDAPDAPNKAMVKELIAESRAGQQQQQEAERMAKLEAERMAAEEAARVAQTAEEREAREAEAAQRAAEMAELRRIAEEMKAAQAAREAEAFKVPPAVEQPKDPVTKKWWFWTAIGAVALAAAGGGTAMALRPTELPAGSLGTLDHRQ